jgi:hypothetical protein
VIHLLRLGFTARAFTGRNGNATGEVHAEVAVLYLLRAEAARRASESMLLYMLESDFMPDE